nr:uncharacterized protein LOC25491804 [Ipomoea batatas]
MLLVQESSALLRGYFESITVLSFPSFTSLTRQSRFSALADKTNGTSCFFEKLSFLRATVKPAMGRPAASAADTSSGLKAVKVSFVTAYSANPPPSCFRDNIYLQYAKSYSPFCANDQIEIVARNKIETKTLESNDTHTNVVCSHNFVTYFETLNTRTNLDYLSRYINNCSNASKKERKEYSKIKVTV